MDPIQNLFGAGDGIQEQRHQFYECQCMEVKQEIIDFLANVSLLHGNWHDTHGWLINFEVWGALLQYVRWCAEQKLDFSVHVSKVQEGDVYYTNLAVTKFAEYGA